MLALLQDSCLLCLTKPEVAQLAAASRDCRATLSHWLFLHHARPHTSIRMYCIMLAELRRMGLLPLYMQLHSPLNAHVVQLAFAYFKDRQSQFATPNISRFFRFTTPPATLTQAQDFGWKRSRVYLQGLQACLQQRHLYSYLALCESDPEYAAQRYPLGTSGLQVLEQLVCNFMWPQQLLQLLLQELRTPRPLLWGPCLALAERRIRKRYRQHGLRQGFRHWAGKTSSTSGSPV